MSLINTRKSPNIRNGYQSGNWNAWD